MVVTRYLDLITRFAGDVACLGKTITIKFQEVLASYCIVV